jgi:hypothetical protein
MKIKHIQHKKSKTKLKNIQKTKHDAGRISGGMIIQATWSHTSSVSQSIGWIGGGATSWPPVEIPVPQPHYSSGPTTKTVSARYPYNAVDMDSTSAGFQWSVQYTGNGQHSINTFPGNTLGAKIDAAKSAGKLVCISQTESGFSNYTATDYVQDIVAWPWIDGYAQMTLNPYIGNVSCTLIHEQGSNGSYTLTFIN